MFSAVVKSLLEHKIVIFSAILVLHQSLFGLGLFAVKRIADLNSCEMTYTSRDRSEIRMDIQRANRSLNNSFLENIVLPDIDYKLWKISNPTSSKLNRQPVLFVPGHRAKFVEFYFSFILRNLINLV